MSSSLESTGRLNTRTGSTCMLWLWNLVLGRWQAPEPDLIQVSAVPGLVTLLDRALFQSVEPMVTATIHSAHAWLEAWLDCQRQAVTVLELLRHFQDQQHDNKNHTNVITAATRTLEALARTTTDAASDAIIRLTTDRLAQSANLSDPYHHYSHGSGNSSNSHQGGHDHHHASGGGGGGGAHNNHRSNSSLQELRALDAGNRRRLPIRQRGRDCWESPRLHCIDHVWAENNYTNGLRWLRTLTKQAAALEQLLMSPSVIVGTNNNNNNNNISNNSQGNSHDGDSLLFDNNNNNNNNSSDAANASSSLLSSSATASHYCSSILSNRRLYQAYTILLKLIRETLVLRLHQFKASLDADSVVTKRLYIIKCEYRAPFRGFLEAHMHLQKVPRLEAVEQALLRVKDTGSVAMKRSSNKDDDAAARRLKELLETPQLIQVVALEQEMEACEVEISNILMPLCNLARYLDAKKAHIRMNNNKRGVSAVELEHFLYRLKNILCKPQRSNTVETSVGIRPLLLDLQGLPRDDETSSASILEEHEAAASLDNNNNSNNNNNSRHKNELRNERIAQLCRQLAVLSELVASSHNNSTTSNNNKQGKSCFVTEAASSSSGRHNYHHHHHQSRDVELSANLVRECRSVDTELLEARLLDWFTMVVQQHNILDEFDMEGVRRQILEAELEAGLSTMMTAKGLQNVLQRITVLHQDCDKRFLILKEVVEQVCLREMNLDLALLPPANKYQPLVLRSTGALGIFGEAMLLAGEKLPIG